MLGNGDEIPNDKEIKGRNNFKMSCGNGVGHEIKPNRLPAFYVKKMLLLFLFTTKTFDCRSNHSFIFSRQTPVWSSCLQAKNELTLCPLLQY